MKGVPILGDSFQIGRLRVRVRAQKHPGGSIGVRIDDAMVYMTDTVDEDGPRPSLRECGFYCNEMWFLDPVDPEIAARIGHSQLRNVLQLASTSGVARLMPVHFNPELDNSALEEIAQMAAAKGVDTIIPIEGACYEI